MDIKKLQDKVVKFRDARDWKQFHNFKDISLSLVLEATEVMEHFQWKNFEEMENHVKKYRREIGDELADVLYWVFLISNDLKIDLEKAFDKKLRKNEKKYPIKKAKGSHKKYTEL